METLSRCGICSKDYEAPTMMSCFHTFCLKCLQNYIDDYAIQGKIQCPLCRKYEDIPRSGASGFKSNYFIQLKCKGRAQEIITCSVCGNGVAAETLCVECEQNFCKICTKNHPKLKICKDHHLLSVKGDKTGPQKISRDVNCQPHKQCVVLYCNTCDELICQECLKGGHFRHDCEDIPEAAEKLSKEIRNFLKTKTIEDYLPFVSCSIDNLTKYEEKVAVESNQIIDAVNINAKQMQVEIEKLRKDMIDSLQEEIPSETKRVQRRLKSTEREFRSSSNVLEYARLFSDFADDTDMLKRGRNIYTSLKKMTDRMSNFQLPDKLDIHFIRGGTIGQKSGKLLGQISKSRSRNYSIKATLVTSFKCSGVDESVSANAVQGEHDYWVVAEKKEIRMYEQSGKLRKTVPMKTQVSDLQILEDGRVLVCCPEAKTLKVIDTKHGVLDFISLDLHPQGIAINRMTGAIVVSVTETVQYSSRKKDAKTKLLVYSDDGTLMEEISRDSKKDNFCFPKMMTLNSNDDICVVDGSDDSVTVLDHDGNVVSKFYGLEKSRSVFIPGDIICDKFGHIIISDHYNGHLHFLNEAGCLLETIALSDKNGEWLPRHLTLDSKSRLWIDDGYGKVKIYEYIQQNAN